MCNGGINKRSLKIFCYTALVVVYLLVVIFGMLYVAKTECAATPAPSLFTSSSAQNSESISFKWYMDKLCDESLGLCVMLSTLFVALFIVPFIVSIVLLFLRLFIIKMIHQCGCTTSSSGEAPDEEAPDDEAQDKKGCAAAPSQMEMEMKIEKIRVMVE